MSVSSMHTIEMDRSPSGVTFATYLHFPDDAHLSMLQLEEMWRLLYEINDDAASRCLVLTGDGDLFFQGPSLGAIAEMRKDTDAILSAMDGGRRLIEAVLAFQKPLVAAVNGPAIGAGTSLALLCDFILASPSAEFRDPHVLIGVPAGDGGTLIWPLLLGFAAAKRHLLLGERLSGQAALEAGILTKLVDADSLNLEARALAERLVALPRFALEGTKAALNQWLRASWLHGGEYAYAMQLAGQLLPDSRAIIGDLVEREQARRKRDE